MTSFPRQVARHLRSFVVRRRRFAAFEVQFTQFVAQCKKEGLLAPRREDWLPCLEDATSDTPFDPHYIYHPAWAARCVHDFAPSLHIDISSSLHFCSILSAFVPAEFYDYRPASLCLPDLTCHAGDLMNLPFATSSIASLSCMHVVEHIGLGRYGEPLDAMGDVKAMNELSRVLARNGQLLFVVPVGRPRIVFNAHRIYSFESVVRSFPALKLSNWSLLPDDWSRGLIPKADPTSIKQQNYACGCFCFVKP